MSTEAELLTGTAPGQVRRLSLRDVARPVGRARDFTRQALADWQWHWQVMPDDETVEDVLLVVSELVANAATHAGGSTELAVALSHGELTVSVCDSARQLPTARTADPSRPGGHGLHIVDILSTDWGTITGPHSKTVWATFRD